MPRLEQVDVLGSASTDCTMCRSWTRFGIDRSERVGEEVRLLLVVAFEADAVAGFDDAFENLGHLFGRDDLAPRELADFLSAAPYFDAQC